MHILKTILSLILIFIIALIFIGIVLPSNNEPIKATIDSDPYINACVFNQINDLNKVKKYIIHPVHLRRLK
jgi:amino acid permease